jgi:hypothetical protein
LLKLAHSLPSSGDPDGVIRWIGGEAEAFDEILSDRGDFCAFADAQGAVSLLEKAGCKHAKAVIQPEFSVSAMVLRRLQLKLLSLAINFTLKCG